MPGLGLYAVMIPILLIKLLRLFTDRLTLIIYWELLEFLSFEALCVCVCVCAALYGMFYSGPSGTGDCIGLNESLNCY